MKKVWRPAKPLRFYGMGSDMTMVFFEEKTNKLRVMRDGHWNFDMCLILMKDYNGRQQTSKLSITEADFWVRIHDLPIWLEISS